MRLIYRMCGVASVGLGIIGLFLPLMPTVPFMLLAAFCFARSNPAWEARLLAHPHFGPPILAWRERRAIGPWAKIASLTMLSGSAIGGLALLPDPWRWVPLAVAVTCGTFIATRPSR
ncbi:MAG: YbaN family protein [Sphingomonas fennica]